MPYAHGMVVKSGIDYLTLTLMVIILQFYSRKSVLQQALLAHMQHSPIASWTFVNRQIYGLIWL